MKSPAPLLSPDAIARAGSAPGSSRLLSGSALPEGTALVGKETLAGHTASTRQEPVAQYLASVKSKLAAAGLPTRAPNARIALIDEPSKKDGTLYDHGQSEARAIAGPIGLAQGAEIRYSQRRPESSTPGDNERISAFNDASTRLSNGQGTIAEYADAFAKLVPAKLRSIGESLDHAASTLPASTDGRAQLLLNLSSGVNIAGSALYDANLLAMKGLDPGSPIYKELQGRLGPHSREYQWTPEQMEGVLRDDMRRAVESPQAQGEIEAAQKELAATVARLRQKGAVVFAAAGNDGDRPGAHPSDTLNFNAVPGMIMVGATDIGNPKNPNDDKLATFSSGAPGYTTLSTVGKDLPIGPGAEREEGTSFASPVAVSIAALMTEANPKLRPDDIQAIMTHPGVARDLPGDRDGAGEVDPVAAVKMAKTWRPRS
jgi:hypothetical protein